MAKPAEDSVGMPAPKPKLTAAQKKKADKELLLQEESRQAREQKQEVEKSVQIDQEAKAKEDENDRSDVGLIFNKSNRSEHNDYWLAHQALQSGNLEQLSKEQSALAEASNQQNERSSIDHKLAQEADVPEQWSSTAKADASTLQGSFQYSNVSMKYQKMQTDDVIKASTDVMPNYGKPWAGSAEETSHVWIILIGQFGIGDSAHATAVSAKLRCAEIKLRWSVHLQTLCLPLRGGIIKLLENIQIQNLKEVAAIVEKNPLDDLPESETKAVEAAPVDWADRQDESFLNLNTTKKKKKPRRKAVPTIESILSDIDEDENVEVINDDAVVVAGAVEVPKKAVKPRARKGKAVKAVEVDSEAIGDDGTVETPNQAPVKVKKPRARKTKTTGTTDVVPEAANNEDIQGPIEAPKKVLKPRASRPKAAKIVEIDSEVDNDDDENDGLGVPKNPFSQSNQGNSQVHAVKKSTAKPRAAAKKPQAKDESEDEDDDVPNIENSRPPRSRAVSKAIVVIDSDDDDDDDDDDQGGQAKSNKKKPAPRKVATKSQKTAGTEVPKHIQALLDNTGTFLAGRTFVVSGTLPTVGRINTEKLSRLYGAKTSRAITKATTDVILGDNPLAKQVKELKDLSPNTMDVDAFIAMLTSLSKDNTNLVGGDDGEDGEEEIEDQPPAKRTKLGMDLSSASSALV